ncbi:TetR/AcrR family transcriptional regulator [Novosphingobium sp. ERN07]|uniref:TetR/AcrR family transcriptional regulator n=1 Tax=Novosphingobium sp. ERN07 TaxID=2726187 RepID=UPI001456B9E4|nr:TetR/AcrR family transcriptional regulator [Novosphingobium sp. ERN07]NLR72021.1 TetR/AcrR family transcriptional regulator [Novosphingobium sp. ERN07]
MPAKPARYAPAANREAILEAALHVFAEAGYEGASTRRIAAAAGIEPGHLAYYFPSKRMLWQAVVEAFAQQGEQVLRAGLQSVAGEPACDVLPRLLASLLKTFAANPQLTRLMLQEFSVSGERHDWVAQSFGIPVWEILRPFFAALESEGLLSGASAAAAYMNLLGGALLAFGTRDYFAGIAGYDPTCEPELSRYIDLLLRPLLQKG